MAIIGEDVITDIQIGTSENLILLSEYLSSNNLVKIIEVPVETSVPVGWKYNGDTFEDPSLKIN